jgi:isoleucyl-tRNA synthetase
VDSSVWVAIVAPWLFAGTQKNRASVPPKRPQTQGGKLYGISMFQPHEGAPDYPSLEPEVLKFWESRQIFQKLVAKNQSGEQFDFQDGPITANNPMGVHHAWGRTYKDLFNRYHAMNGRRLRWQNGFDCQGLWVEVEVEKALGFKGKPDILAFGMANFSRACRERVERFASVITEQSKRLGMWNDWESSYYTFDDSNIENIWLFLSKCHEEGWLGPDYRVMPWCPRCETSLSQHESNDAYQDITHRSVYLQFPVETPLAASSTDAPSEDASGEDASGEDASGEDASGEDASGEDAASGVSTDYFLVWTTTPWTLTANVALAVNPGLVYVRAKTDDKTVILSKGTVASALKPGYEVLEELSGADLVGLTYSGPFDDIPFQVENEATHPRRVVAADWVDESDGTGIVHIAPGCGDSDFQLGQSENLGFIAPVTTSAHFKSECGKVLAGLHALEDVETVFSEVEKRGRLYRVQRFKHSYPHCWRCGSELIFFATQEWFIRADAGERPARERLKTAASTVEWNPDYGGKRLDDWLSNMGDWNISRKRFWGLPLPFWRDDESGEWEVISSRAQLRERAVDPQKVDELPELHRPWIDEIEIWNSDRTRKLRRVPEVGDAWLDAGIVPFSTVGFNGASDIRKADLRLGSPDDWRPVDFISEMREQIRLWFFSMLWMSVALEDRAPYQRVLLYETMLDQHGQRISKKLGNGVPFGYAIAVAGADPMRWTFCQNPVTKDIRFGLDPRAWPRAKNLTPPDGALGWNPLAEPQADESKPVGDPVYESSRRLLTLWNVYGFFIGYANLDHPDLMLELAPQNVLDKWILARLQTCISNTARAFEQLEPQSIVREIEAFVDDLSNWYVRRGKRRFWKSESDSDKAGAYSTLHHVLLTLSKLLAPALPFSSEMMYRNLSSVVPDAPESVHLCEWPRVDERLRDDDLVSQVEGVLQAVSLGLSARKESKIRVRQPLSKALVQAPDEAGASAIRAWQDTIKDELNVKEIELLSDAGDLVTYSLKANLPVVGKKYGKGVGALRKLLEGATPDEAKRIGSAIKAGESVSVELDGAPATLEPTEVLVETKQASGYSFASDGGWSVGLDTTLTDELVVEGLARDFIRVVQDGRKRADFEVSDRIAILLVQPGEDSRLPDVLESFGDTIQSETLADELRFVDANYPELSDGKMGEETLRFRVEKANTNE